jgi:glycosyltransferase involved in cell wall biosynthesis
MACKVPVIATDSGGIPEAVIHRETGWLCPPQKPETLAAAIEALLSDPILANQLADRAYNYVRNNFSFERMINNYEAVYKRTITERRFS